MNKDELVRKLAEEFGISTIDIYQLVNTVIGSMSSALSKGKNINISEFGKFKTLTRKDDAGNTVKTVSFSPVKKFANEVNFRYNDLSPTPIGLSKEEVEDDALEEVYEEEVALIEEVSETFTFDSKNLSVNINPSVMDNKDKYDGNIIRDEISKDTSNDPSDAINAFINSKLEKPQKTDNTMDSGIKEFELPHTLIELHNDITNEEVEPIELPEIKDSIDIENLIEERKKALGDITTEQSEPVHEQTNYNTGEGESRDNLDEFKSFEEERNAELSKIIEERNKIIDDIHEMVNTAGDIPEMKESPIEEKPLEEKPLENKPIKVNQQTEPSVDEKPVIDDLPPLQEDKTFEHKFQYEANIQDNFDPIVTDDENNSSNDNVFSQEVKPGDITPPPIVTENIKIEGKRVENPPTSFEDVFETKDDTEKQKEVIHSSLPPINQDKSTAPPPPVQNVQKPQTESYRQRMQRREQMYEESSKKSKKKGLWITALVLGFIILVVYLAYNTGTFTPPSDKNNDNQQNNNEQQNSGKTNEQTPPPVANENTVEKGEDPKQENQQTNEQTPPPLSNTSEEVTFDNALNVAFVKTSDGIFIQTASLKSKSDADRMAAGINKGNKEVFVKEADLGDKGKYFRVRIGKFASMDEAKEFAGKLK